MQNTNSNQWLEKTTALGDSVGGVLGDATLHASPWFLLYFACGFALGLILAIYLAKKHLLKRNQPVWNVLAKLSYILILAAMPLALGVIGVLHSVQSTINQEIEMRLLPAVTEQMPAVSHALNEQLKRYPTGKIITVKDLVEPLVSDMYYIPKSESLWERSKARVINDMILRRGATALTEAVQQALLGKLQHVGQVMEQVIGGGRSTPDDIVKIGTDVIMKFTTDSAREIDFTQLEKTVPEMLVDALKNNIDNYLKSTRKTILIILAGMLLLIVGEILYYRRYLQKPVKINIASTSTAGM
jgi:hypothetical protein